MIGADAGHIDPGSSWQKSRDSRAHSYYAFFGNATEGTSMRQHLLRLRWQSFGRPVIVAALLGAGMLIGVPSGPTAGQNTSDQPAWQEIV